MTSEEYNDKHTGSNDGRQPPWIPYTQGDSVPMGRVKLKYKRGQTLSWEDDFTEIDWQHATHYQRHPDHQLIADMRDELCLACEHARPITLARRIALILRAEAVVGRAPGLPQWLVDYLDGETE